MRKTQPISIARIREVLTITSDGLVYFRINNFRRWAGSRPRPRRVGRSLYIRVDGKSVNLAKVAWAYHTGMWPSVTPRQHRRDPNDYSIRNLHVVHRSGK